MSLSDLIDAIPDILRYVIPGYTTLLTMHLISNYKINKDSQWVISATISFITIAILESLATLRGVPWMPWGLIVVASLCDIGIGLLYCWITLSEWWKDWAAEHLHIMNRAGTISYYVDWKHGSNVRIELKNSDKQIIGHIKTVGDNNGDGMICISGPVIVSADGDIECNRDGQGSYMVIPIEELKLIEIFNRDK